MKKFDQEIKKIEIEKEVLDTLPTNNKKNEDKLYLKLAQDYKSYSNNQKLILDEIEKRFNRENNIKSDDQISKLESSVNELKEDIFYLNTYSTSYEKMELDQNIHNIKYYFVNDLQSVNQNILDCIKKFNNVGIKLSANDFKYISYVNDYMKVFFENINNINSSKIKKCFEEIYWKCPEIITYIELNIRYLFYKNEKEINKYYESKRRPLVDSSEDTINKYNDLQSQLLTKKIFDKHRIINQFYLGKLVVQDYTNDKIRIDLSQYIQSDILKKITDARLQEIVIEMIKFRDTLKEYKLYIKFKFIIDNIIEIYSKKENNKKNYIKTKKEIKKREKKILRLNKKCIFHKSKEKNLVKQTKLALEVKDLYEKLDKYRVYCQIGLKINESSTLFDALYLASFFYEYLFDCIKQHDNSLSEDQIKAMIEELKMAVLNPNYNIINNVIINDNKNIMYIIKDKYQLSNIMITEDQLDEKNLDSLIEALNKYEVYYIILKYGIDINQINEYCEFYKILRHK